MVTGKISKILIISLLPILAFSWINESEFINKLKLKLEQHKQKFPEEKIYIQTDKSYYLPGESIWFNGFVLNSNTHRPTRISDVLYVELIAPNGQIKKKLDLYINNGTSNGDFHIDSSDPGGIYEIKAYTQWNKNFGLENTFSKKLTIQKISTPRLLLTLDFVKESYGVGSDVQVELQTKDLQNNPLVNAQINYTLKVKGQEYLKKEMTTHNSGITTLEFILPDTLKTTDVFLQVIVNNKGTEESISRTVPISLNNITMQFFPEGGQYVEGVKTRMAFKALNEYGKGADVEGKILGNRDEIITTFKSSHMGMGSFEFTPVKGKKYHAIVEKPFHNSETLELPEPLKDGFTLNLTTQDKKNIIFSIHAPKTSKVSLVGHIHGEFIYGEELDLKPGLNEIKIGIEKFPRGIGVFTLFDNQGTGQCERLVFINENKGLIIKIETDKEKYLPREEVHLKIKTLDGKGNNVPTKLSLSVVDEQLLTFADDKQDNILSSMLLSSEIKGEIQEPSYYFDPEEETRYEDLDHLLMTQGWRRFTWEEVLNPKVQITHIPEKISQITGITTTKNGKPISTEVSFIELGGSKRIIKLNSRSDGFFVVKNIDPRVSALLLVKKHLKIEVKEGNIIPNSTSQYPFYGAGYSYYNDEIFSNSNTVEIVNTDEESEGEPVSSQVNVSLSNDVTQLSEIIVTGYGVAEKSNLTSSISSISSNNLISRNPIPSISNLLQGRVAGVTIIEQQMTPGAGSTIRIRGISSLSNGQEPLYVIDGHPINFSNNSNFNIGNLINPEDINSISVLNSAEAILLYGNAAANGVVVISTKDGLSNSYYSKAWPRFTGVTVGRRQFSQTREFYTPPPAPFEVVERNDFRTTVFWENEVVTDEDGNAELVFYNNDAVSSFRIVTEGITPFGEIGRSEINYHTSMPLAADIRVPEFIGMEDIAYVPVRITNESEEQQSATVEITVPRGITLNGPENYSVDIPSGESKTAWFTLKSSGQTGEFPIDIEVKSVHFQDKMTRQLKVKNIGFPIKYSFSSMSDDTTFHFSINDMEKGTLKAEFTAYLNIFSDLMDGVESIFREPYGCFEQVSSSNYPNILAMQLLKQSGESNKSIETNAMRYLTSGYKKLIAYEIKGGGFEWYGDPPAHEGLSAYGLLQFMEMKKVSNLVDEKMLERTYQWIMSRKNGNGSFHQNQGKYGFSSASDIVNNAYLIYALSEYKQENLDKEYAKAYQEAMSSKDHYRLPLLAMASYNLDKKQGYRLIIDYFREFIEQKSFKNIRADHSIVRSYGNSFNAEILSLWTLALLKDAQNNLPYINTCISELVKYRKHGGFGSTQATALALKSLTLYSQYVSSSLQGKIAITTNGTLSEEGQYSNGNMERLTMTSFQKDLKTNENSVNIRFLETESPVSNSLNVSYFTKTPPSNTECKVALNLKYSSEQLSVNEFLRLNIQIKNKTNDGLPSTIAEIGIPGGLSLQPWQLKELQEKKVFDYYEILDGKLVIYYREMGPNETKNIQLDLKAEVPGQYTGVSSSTYLYYTNEYKHWVKGIIANVAK
ncbi:MAG: TonB-dependent receptor plug domain-containing protein [Cyclobacteriaceae bacterium]|nr:TonB-dependent receptor plug domain-containing protein [Cyclobacteriaceae bacterium]